MGNIETTTKFSRLKTISSSYSFPSICFICFQCLFTITKENYHPLLRRKCSLKLDLKKSEFLKSFLNLSVFVSFYNCNYKKKL